MYKNICYSKIKRFWPDSRQWRKWSLLNKLSAIGTLVAIITFIFFLFEKSFNFFEYIASPKKTPSIEIDIKFKYKKDGDSLVLNKENPHLVITNVGTMTISPIIVDADMSIFDSNLSVVSNYVGMDFETHGHLLFEPRLEPGRSIEQGLSGVRNWGKPAVYRIRVEMHIASSKQQYTENCLFIVDANGIKKENREIITKEANKLRSIVASFLQSPDTRKKLTLTAPVDGTWLSHPEPKVDMQYNEDGSITVK